MGIVNILGLFSFCEFCASIKEQYVLVLHIIWRKVYMKTYTMLDHTVFVDHFNCGILYTVHILISYYWNTILVIGYCCKLRNKSKHVGCLFNKIITTWLSINLKNFYFNFPVEDHPYYTENSITMFHSIIIKFVFLSIFHVFEFSLGLSPVIIVALLFPVFFFMHACPHYWLLF